MSTRTAKYTRRPPVFAYNSVTADSRDSTDSPHAPDTKYSICKGCWSCLGRLEQRIVGIAVTAGAQYTNISRRSPGPRKYRRQHDIYRIVPYVLSFPWVKPCCGERTGRRPPRLSWSVKAWHRIVPRHHHRSTRSMQGCIVDLSCFLEVRRVFQFSIFHR